MLNLLKGLNLNLEYPTHCSGRLPIKNNKKKKKKHFDVCSSYKKLKLCTPHPNQHSTFD